VIRNAIIGGICWAALAVGSVLSFARLGTIELLFLLGPLVIVPLGVELSTRLDRGDQNQKRMRFLRNMQIIAALCAVASLLVSTGNDGSNSCIAVVQLRMFPGFPRNPAFCSRRLQGSEGDLHDCKFPLSANRLCVARRFALWA